MAEPKFRISTWNFYTFFLVKIFPKKEILNSRTLWKNQDKMQIVVLAFVESSAESNKKQSSIAWKL